ncbi:Por secretion system C-terminal sorting domain-containing protein [Candidatus Kryptobacter tengchongensis]|nr:Por secretion system C-terminal sorting domain-containing protein [Candidatus Kryptobacter tengchongensis]
MLQFKIFILLALTLNSIIFSQIKFWDVPLNSTDNVLILTLENLDKTVSENLNVEFASYPSWVKVKNRINFVSKIDPGDSVNLIFKFDVDKNAPPDSVGELLFKLKNNKYSYVKIIRIKILPPQSFKLYQNYPNPFNLTTRIGFEIPEKSHIRIIIYDQLGRVVKKLVDKDMSAGYFEVEWDGRNDRGVYVSSGIYFYCIFTEKWSDFKKMILLK